MMKTVFYMNLNLLKMINPKSKLLEMLLKVGLMISSPLLVLFPDWIVLFLEIIYKKSEPILKLKKLWLQLT